MISQDESDEYDDQYSRQIRRGILPYRELFYSLQRHTIEHGNRCNNCKWYDLLGKVVRMSDERICRVCGRGEVSHSNPDDGKVFDHEFVPLDITAPQRFDTMTLEEYRVVSNEALGKPPKEFEAFKTLFNYTLDKEKSVLEMSPEEIVDHIAYLEKAIVIFRTHQYQASIRLTDIEKELTEQQRHALRERSKSYKVKPVETGDASGDAPKTKRAPGRSKEEKALETIMTTFGWTKEQALEFIDKQKSS